MARVAEVMMTAAAVLGLTVATSAAAPQGTIDQLRDTDREGLETTVQVRGAGFEGALEAENGRAPLRDEGAARIRWDDSDEDAIVSDLALSADGDWLAVSYELNAERFELRSMNDGEVVITYVVNDGGGWVAISADGRYAALSALDSLWIFDRLEDLRPVFRYRFQGYRMGPVEMTADGERVLVTGVDEGGETNRVWCFQPGEEEPEWTYEVSQDESFGWYGAVISGDGSLTAVNGKFHLYILGMDDGDLIWEEPTYNTESQIALSADGTILAYGTLTGFLRVFARDEDAGYRELWRYSFTGDLSNWVSSCAVSADGSTVAAGTLDFFEDRFEGRLALFDTYDAAEALWISEPFADEIAAVSLSDAGGVIAAVTWGDLEHQAPDLAIFERHSSEPFYTLSTPGSLDLAVMTGDGAHLAVGGKAVHNRAWGRGGILYALDVSRPGGWVSGTVSDADGEPVVGAVVEAWGGVYRTETDGEGGFLLLVEVEDEDEADIVAHKPGYMNDFAAGVDIARGDTTRGVELELEPAGLPPENLHTSRNDPDRVTLVWDRYAGEGRRAIGLRLPLLEAAPSGIAQDAASSLKPVDPLLYGADSFNQRPAGDAAPRRDDPEGFNIYRSYVTGGPYRLVGTVAAEDTSYTDEEGLLPLHDYYYVVTADFGDGESGYSNETAGHLQDDYLVWEFDLEPLEQEPELDGSINDGEWDGASAADISDTYGYDGRDSAGSVTARIGFSDETDRLYLAFNYRVQDEIAEGMGVGVYIDDNGDGEWSLETPGGEGNYWGYWLDGQPEMFYRSLVGPPHNARPYYQFEQPELAFSDDGGYVQIEMAVPLGFHAPWETALYYPDYTIGLALFAMHRDPDDAPIFNGWWPQDMFSIVSYPSQFARVRVPAELAVPPRKPRDLELERQNGALHLAWTDPDTGLDNGPLPVLAGLTIQRNGEPFTQVDAGVESFLDSVVVRGGWYEYRVGGFVLEDGEPFAGRLSPPVGAYAVQDPSVDEVAYDDGFPEAYYVVSFDWDENRFAVKFDLENQPDTVSVYWIDVYTGSADSVEISVWDDDGGMPGAVVGEGFATEVTTTDQFHRFHFPDVRQPAVPADDSNRVRFWAVLSYYENIPAAPSLGVDFNNPDGTRNYYFKRETGWRALDAGQLMVRAGVGVPLGVEPPGEEPPLPTAFRLGQNRPNPFNSSTLVPLELPVPVAGVRVALYDTGGRLVLTRSLGGMGAGYRLLSIESAGLGSGVYLLRVEAGGFDGTIKTCIIK